MYLVFDHSSCGLHHLRESEQRGRIFLAMESVNSLRISAPQWWPFKKGETGSVKGETKGAKFWQGKVWTHRNCANFWQGKKEICSIFSRSRVLAHRPCPKLEMFSHRFYNFFTATAKFWGPITAWVFFCFFFLFSHRLKIRDQLP